MPVGDWLRPQWPAPARVHACFTTRAGGVSAPPFSSLNLGDHVGDRPEDVAVNRGRLGAALGRRPVFLHQVHGWEGCWLDVATPDGTVADWCAATAAEAQKVAAVVMVADCLPILMCDTQGRAVAAAHAGWRGLAGDASGRGVVECCVEALLQRLGCGSVELLTWLGPCIGPTRFEVGAEVRDAFTAQTPHAAARFRPGAPNKYWADLPGLARDRLARLGVQAVYGNDGSRSWCTVSDASRFFSHRRDRVSGRLAACIWVD